MPRRRGGGQPWKWGSQGSGLPEGDGRSSSSSGVGGLGRPVLLGWRPKAQPKAQPALGRMHFKPKDADDWSEASSSPRAGENFEEIVRSRLGGEEAKVFEGQLLEEDHHHQLQELAAKINLIHEDALPTRLRNLYAESLRNFGESAMFEIDTQLLREVDVKEQLGSLAVVIHGPSKLPVGTIVEVTVNAAATLVKFFKLERMLLLSRTRSEKIPHICVVTDRCEPLIDMDALLHIFPNLKPLSENGKVTVVHWRHTVPATKFQEVEEKNKALEASVQEVEEKNKMLEASVQEVEEKNKMLAEALETTVQVVEAVLQGIPENLSTASDQGIRRLRDLVAKLPRQSVSNP